MPTNNRIEIVMELARSLLTHSLDPDTSELSDLMKIEGAACLAQSAHVQMYPDADVDAAEVIKRLRAEYTITQETYSVLDDGGKDHEEWWKGRLAELDHKLPYWQRYKVYVSKRMPAPVVDRLDRLTDRTLGLLENPEREGEWDRRGLVVGQVQSGKTSNYIGLICKAVDAGYKLIVVLAGMHNNLRSQTQLRLDRGFLGFDTDMNLMLNKRTSRVGVGLLPCEIPTQSMSLTTNAEKGDFLKGRAQNAGIPLGQMPTLLVVKKNKGVLEKVISWATSVKAKRGPDGRDYIGDVPLLVIDDEADNASVNAKKKEVAAINRKIRELLQLFKKTSYVGYTATPFANVFIDPDVEHDELGKDIYPESFIVNMPAPSNYFGPVRVFGLKNDQFSNLEESDPLPLVHYIDREDFESHFPPKHRTTLRVTGLPRDLLDAVKSFYLTISARRARGQIQVHNSMLVHVTRLVAVQNQVKELLQDEVDGMRRLIEFGDQGFIGQLEQKWKTEFEPVTEQMAEEFDLEPVSWSQVRAELPGAACDLLPVKAINGHAKDALEYAENPAGISVICVGGDKLARGLTLEGLSVSYFARSARMYDTLMQMGRWFGYRQGYQDLCRLYTTREIAMCFEHVTLASEELRQQFDRMEATGGTPRDYGNSVRTSPHGMLITAMGKMRNAIKMDLSFSNRLVEMYYYSRNKTDIEANLRHTDTWLNGLDGPPALRKHPDTKGHIWSASADDVIDFLSGYSCPSEAWRCEGGLLSGYIRVAKSHGCLERWVVALLDPDNVDDRHSAPIGGLSEIGMFFRADAQNGDNTKPYSLIQARLGSKQDEALGLADQDWQRALDETTRHSKRRKTPTRPDPPYLRAARSKDGGTGLLMLYLLNPEGGFIEKELPLVGYALSFPPVAGDSKVSLKVSKDFLKQEFHYEEDDDED